MRKERSKIDVDVDRIGINQSLGERKMKFNCIHCGNKEFSVDIQELVKDKVAINIICPTCENGMIITAFNEAEVEIKRSDY